MGLVGKFQDHLGTLDDLSLVSMVNFGRSHKFNVRVPVLVVMPGERLREVAPGFQQTREVMVESWPVLGGLELDLGVETVIWRAGTRVRFGHSKIAQGNSYSV